MFCKQPHPILDCVPLPSSVCCNCPRARLSSLGFACDARRFMDVQAILFQIALSGPPENRPNRFPQWGSLATTRIQLTLLLRAVLPTTLSNLRSTTCQNPLVFRCTSPQQRAQKMAARGENWNKPRARFRCACHKYNTLCPQPKGHSVCLPHPHLKHGLPF